MIYGLVESTIFRMLVYGQDDSVEMKKAIDLAIDGLQLKK